MQLGQMLPHGKPMRDTGLALPHKTPPLSVGHFFINPPRFPFWRAHTNVFVLQVGVTVAYVKLALQQQYGLPMATTQLKLNGRPLLDPLSLSDCPGISAGQEVSVEVINTHDVWQTADDAEHSYRCSSRNPSLADSSLTLLAVFVWTAPSSIWDVPDKQSACVSWFA
eukprot:353517-Chlamydomonas_euryale.AAC.2